MNGEQLYKQYAQIQLDYNCKVDSWDELDAKDKAVWDVLAHMISLH